MTAEEQIARLEELAYFQENLLSQLNEALTGQQKQLDMLEKRLAELEANVTTLLDAAPEAQAWKACRLRGMGGTRRKKKETAEPSPLGITGKAMTTCRA